ncbi:hypothetical protein BH20ACI2_BH20ACI2_11570 [soil metagenome]
MKICPGCQNTYADDNLLEVRDLDDKIELYINGTMVNSIRNAHGYPNGVMDCMQVMG